MRHTARLVTTTMVAEDDTAPAGSRAVVKWERRTGGVVEITDIVVDDRRQGRGSALVAEVVRLLPPEVRTVYAWTRASNEVARRFWASCGFAEAAVVERFYGDGCSDAECAGVFLVRSL